MTVTNSGGAMKNVKIVNEADLQANIVDALSTNLALVIAAINAVEIDTGDIDLNIDALEALQTAANALLTGIDADTDAIKTAVEVMDDAHNSSDSSFDNTILNFPSATPMQETKTTLTAAGVTDAIGVSGKVYHAISYTIASIDTNVVVRAEGSINDGATYFNLSAAGVDTTKTVNDTFPMTYIGKLSHIRFRFVSETGGTYATITPSFMSGN